jgi:hypothetical protein
MSELEFTTEDMAQMRREGTRRAFFRLVSRPSAGPVREAAEPVSSRTPADHKPGAWPVAPSGAADDVHGPVCACSRCASFAKGQPELDELLRRTQEYLDGQSA